MYWVTFATFITVEKTVWFILAWIPLYRVMRVGLFAWLALPQFKGAELLYTRFVRPFLLVAVKKAKEVPALEPYVRDFNSKVCACVRCARRGRGAGEGDAAVGGARALTCPPPQRSPPPRSPRAPRTSVPAPPTW